MTQTVERITGSITALSPIVHFGDEKTGSTPVLRAITVWNPDQGRHVRLPFISGNAIRGVLRRLVMADLVQLVGYEVKSPKLHHALFTGGILEGTDAEGDLDLAFRREVRETLPPLGLFGSAIRNQMIPSCLKVEHAIPYCLEYRSYLPETDDPRLQHSIRTFTDFTFATRRDDLRSEREEGEQATQMLIEFEAFVPGTRFAHGFVLTYASALERSCLGRALELWREQPYLGGKSGSGYGHITFEYTPTPDPAEYVQYCRDNAERIRQVLDTIAERLS